MFAGKLATLWSTAVVGAALAVAPVGCAGDDEPTSDAARDSKPTYLFVHDAESGVLDPKEGILEMRGASPMVTFFSDRPQRIAGHRTFASFAANWSKMFRDDPPNAAIEYDPEVRRLEVPTVEILEPPQKGNGKVVYRVQLLNPNKFSSRRASLRGLSSSTAPRS